MFVSETEMYGKIKNKNPHAWLGKYFGSWPPKNIVSQGLENREAFGFNSIQFKSPI